MEKIAPLQDKWRGFLAAAKGLMDPKARQHLLGQWLYFRRRAAYSFRSELADGMERLSAVLLRASKRTRPSAERPQAPTRLTSAPESQPEPESVAPAADSGMKEIDASLHSLRKLPSLPPPRPQVTSSGDLMEALFEEVHELHFKENLQEGADFVAKTARKLLPGRAALVHLYDINQAEFRLMAVDGIPPEQLHGLRAPQQDPVISSALRKDKVLQGTIARIHPLPARYGRIRSSKRLATAPCARDGQDVGAIELIDPVSSPLPQLQVDALAYLAQVFTDFVIEKGLVLPLEESNTIKKSKLDQKATA